MNTWSRFALVSCLTAMVGACSFGDKDNSEPPTPLEEFKPSISINKLWEVKTDADISKTYLQLKPLVSTDRIYVSTPKGKVQAFERSTGHSIWSIDTGISLSSAPGLGEGLLLVGSLNGELLALDPSNGNKIWQTRLSSEILAVSKISSEIVFTRTVDGRLTAVDARDGSRLWVYESNTPQLTLRGTSEPLLRDDRVYASFANGLVACVEKYSGKVLWETQVAQARGRSDIERIVDIDAELKIEGETLYVSSFQGRSAGLDPYSGDILWVKESSVYSDFALDAEHMYISDESSDIYALDRYSGSAMWKQPKLHARRLSGLSVVDSYVVAGDIEGYIHYLSARDGDFAGRLQLDKSGIRVVPISVDSVLYVLTNNGNLYALQTEFIDYKAEDSQESAR